MRAIYFVLAAFAVLPGSLALQPLGLKTASDDLSSLRKNTWASFLNVLKEAETSDITSRDEFTQLAEKQTVSLMEQVQKLRQQRPELKITPETLLSNIETEIGAGTGGPAGALVQSKVAANSTADMTQMPEIWYPGKYTRQAIKDGSILCYIAPPLVLFAADRFCGIIFFGDELAHAACVTSLALPLVGACEEQLVPIIQGVGTAVDTVVKAREWFAEAKAYMDKYGPWAPFVLQEVAPLTSENMLEAQPMAKIEEQKPAVSIATTPLDAPKADSTDMVEANPAVKIEDKKLAISTADMPLDAHKANSTEMVKTNSTVKVEDKTLGVSTATAPLDAHKANSTEMVEADLAVKAEDQQLAFAADSALKVEAKKPVISTAIE